MYVGYRGSVRCAGYVRAAGQEGARVHACVRACVHACVRVQRLQRIDRLRGIKRDRVKRSGDRIRKYTCTSDATGALQFSQRAVGRARAPVVHRSVSHRRYNTVEKSLSDQRPSEHSPFDRVVEYPLAPVTRSGISRQCRAPISPRSGALSFSRY